MKKRKALIAIIILHFGKWSVTKQCLDSLQKIDSDNFDYKVILLNNSNLNIKRHGIVKKYINPPHNTGFAQGNNLAVEATKNWSCDYLLFLNNDTKVEAGFLTNLLKAFKKHKNLGIVGPVIEHKVGAKTLFDYGGTINFVKTQAKHINKSIYEKKSEIIYRDFVSGCCLLIPAKLFEQVGGFCQKYFLYLEDVDLNLKVSKLRYKIGLITGSKIFHLGSQSATENQKIYYSLRNSFRLIFSHTPKKYWLSSISFNSYFYPSLWLKWNGKRFLKNLFKYLAHK
jgi:GT2 family glycosyltransferase